MLPCNGIQAFGLEDKSSKPVRLSLPEEASDNHWDALAKPGDINSWVIVADPKKIQRMPSEIKKALGA